MDPSMDAAHRGATAQGPAVSATNQPAASSAASPAVSIATGPATSRAGDIDPPRPCIDKPGFVDNDDGANIRTGPAERHGVALTPRPLPPATRVFVTGRHPEAPEWWYVTAFLPGTIVRGYVQHFRVNIDLPEPTAKLYQIQPGDTVERLASQEFSAAVRDGHDLRYYENVLLAVNRDKNRAGIQGTFQDPGVLGGGANNIQLEAGRRIWLVSPAHARALEGKVPDGSLTGGLDARTRRVLGHIDDIVQSVTGAPQYFSAVAGEYAEAIEDHLPEIIGITAGFILAESASAFLAATPTGVGQLAAVVIQLGLAAFGAAAAVDACGQALQQGQQWLTLAWTAHGDPEQLAAASKEFLKMLVSIAMAALTIAGVRANMGKGLKVASAIEIQPPMLGWSPAMATPNGVVAGGPVLTPGSIASAGPVNIGGPSLMSATGSGAGKAKADSRASQEQPERRNVESHENAGGHTDEKHIGKSESWLRQRLAREPDLDAASSFRNEAVANRTQGAFVRRYHEQIDAWLASGEHIFRGKIEMGHPIGIVVERSGRVAETSRALLILVRDSSAHGWHFLTSFPVP
ncbi:MAG TPA: RNase A-like domain-containing protein [Haliangium sp.]|nr:RNase A-like domain-containing protein [Haliangium sp.]